MHRKELFYYVTCAMCTDAKLFSVGRIENGDMANQIHGFTIDYGKFILMELLFNFHTLYEFQFSDWLICTT